jgi:hypothetical protein
MIFELLAALVSLWCCKILDRFILDWLMSCPNCNLVLNHASSQDGKRHFNWNWPENPTTTLASTDGVLLEVRNRKERCHAWSLIATASRVRTLIMLFFQYSIDMSIALLKRSFSYTTGLGLCVSNFNQIHSLLLVIVKLFP